jgi:outer membrane protein assembly factor BamB
MWRMSVLAGCLLAAGLAPYIPDEKKPGADWPTWRGTNRDNISPDKGLLKVWPADGPTLAWKAGDLGQGFSTVAVAADKVFVTGDVDNETFLFALSRDKGDKIWSAKIGNVQKLDHPGARSTPTVDGERVYVLGQFGDLVCFKAADGAEVWRKHLIADFGGKCGGWKYCESLLIDGDRLVCTPGGNNALVALDKKDGGVIWLSDFADTAQHASVVISNAGGVRQYVQTLANGVVGVAARDGKVLWRYEKLGKNTANAATSIVQGDHVFCTSGYSKGGALLTLSVADGKWTAQEEYFSPLLKNRLGGVVQVGDYIYGDQDSAGNPWCVEWKSGNIVQNWLKGAGVRKGKGSASITYADGNLYIRYDNGYVALVPADPEGYQEKGLFKIPNSTSLSYPHPVVIGGRLYLREKDTLWVYDVKAK